MKTQPKGKRLISTLMHVNTN